MKNSAQSATHITVTGKQIEADLRRIGVSRGDQLAVVLSFKSLGSVLGGPDAFIDALLNVVSPSGTVMMNTFTKPFFPISKISVDYVFDPASTRPWTGIVPTTFMKRKDAIRSNHPICSVVAVGRFAEYLTSNHAENMNALVPYERLAQIEGKYLCIGLGDRLVAIRHEAQRRAGLFYVPFLYMGVRYKDLRGDTKLFVGPLSGCYKNLEKIVPEVERRGVIKRGNIGEASSILANCNELIEVMASIWKENPTLTLCDDILCLPCRDLERRMNLYSKIVNPRLFQKNLFLIRLLRLRLKLARKHFSYVSFNQSFLQETVLESAFFDSIAFNESPRKETAFQSAFVEVIRKLPVVRHAGRKDKEVQSCIA